MSHISFQCYLGTLFLTLDTWFLFCYSFICCPCLFVSSITFLQCRIALGLPCGVQAARSYNTITMPLCLYNEGGNETYVVSPILIVFASFLSSIELYFVLLYSSIICVKKERCIWIVVWVLRKLCIWDKTVNLFV